MGLEGVILEPQDDAQWSPQVAHWEPHHPDLVSDDSRWEKPFDLQRCKDTAGCDSSCTPARAAASPEARPPWESPSAGPG